MNEDENFNLSNIEEIYQAPLQSPLLPGRDINQYVDMIRQAINNEQNVTVVDESHTVSAFVLSEINNQLNYEMDRKIAVYVNLEDFPSFSEFMTKLVNDIFFYVTETDDELCLDVNRYIRACENDVQNRRIVTGEMRPGIRLYFGDNLLGEARDLIYDIDQMLREKNCRIVLIVDDTEAIENLKERNNFAEIFCMLMYMRNLSVVTGYRSKEVRDMLNPKFRNADSLSLDLTPVGYQKRIFAKADKAPSKRGRKPGSKNTKTSEKENIGRSASKSASKKSEPTNLKKRKYVRRQAPKDPEVLGNTNLLEGRDLEQFIEYAPSQEENLTSLTQQPEK